MRRNSSGIHSRWNTGGYDNILKRSGRLSYLPWAVLGFMLLCSWQLWKNAERHAFGARQVEFDLRVQGAADRIKQRMLDYEQVLYGTRGFFINQHEVEHREFHGYIESLQLAQRFPGVQGVSYAPLVPAQRKQAHIAAVRRDGMADYTIKPDSMRDAYAPVAYIEPYAGRNLRVLGFDNFSSPQRKASLEEARDLDQAVISEKLALMQEDGQAPQPGCLIFLPVYKADTAHATLAERRADIAGWLAASFRMVDLMAGIVARDADELDIEIYDGVQASEQSLLFDSDNHASEAWKHLFQATAQVDVAGHPWLINAHSLPAFEAAMDKSKANLTALAGVLLSIVLAGLTALLVRDRRRALQLAEGASSELRQNKEFQAALRENEQRWKLALEAAGHGVWDWNVETDEVTCSELSKQMRGYSADNYPYRFFGDWGSGIHPEDLPRVMPAIQAHLEGNTPAFIFEYRALCKNGEWKWIITRGTVVESDAQGKPLRMLGTHTDISERRAIQAELEEQKQFAESIIDSLPGNFYMLDTSGHHVRWNKNTEKVTGYAADEMAHLNAQQFFEVEERAAIQGKMREIFERGEGEIEAGLLLKDGRKIPYHFSGRRCVIGGQDYLVGVGFDVSARKAAEAAKQLSEAKLQAILDYAPVGIWLVGVNGRYQFVNKTFSDAVGIPESAFLAAEHLGDIMDPATAAACINSDKAAFMQDAPYLSRETLTFVDGKAHLLEIRKVQLHDLQGETLGIIGISVDITESERAEEELRESEERYREIFNDANFFIFTLDTAQRFSYVSPILGQLVGYGRDELIGEHVGKVLTPESLEKALQMQSVKLRGAAAATQYELELFHKDGRIIPVEINTSLAYKQGKVVGVQGAGRDITERHKYEQALRESEEKYRGLFENVGDLAYSTDLNGNFAVVNEALLEVTGYDREELVGAPISKILTPEMLALARQMTAAKLAGEKQVTRYELEITARNGRQIQIEVVSSLVYKDGKPDRVQGIGRDITERHKYEQALRESEENYRGLFGNVGDLAFVTDLETRFTEVSDSLLEVTGYSRDELIQASIGKLMAPEDLEVARQMTAAKLAGENLVTRYELEIFAKDGRPILLEVVSTLLYKDGKPIRVQGIGRDIGERKRAEEALQLSERNYRELMEQAADAIFVTDHEGQRCLEVNQAACDMLGYTREEFLGHIVSETFHPEEISREPIRFEDVKAGKVIHTKRRLRHKDGHYVPVEMGARMTFNGRLLAVVRDITDWLVREEALRAANAKAEEASRTKGEFLANMSHEIRTPMNSVIGMARLALSRETDSRQLDYLEKILMSGEHLLGIIDDILDFSKIEAGKFQIENANLDLRSVMDSLASLMGGKAAAKGLKLIVEVDPALPVRLRGDPLRLRQVLLNFADNAIKFTAQGEVAISARKIGEESDGCEVRFEVRDSGIGMNATELAMLFRSFQQTDGSVTRKYGGTGLGLSISKRLVELMGGEVGVASEPGRGSTFWFRLRLDDGVQDGAPVMPQASDRRETQSALRSTRILLAENNLFNQQVAREFLELAGCVVQVANDGAEALALLQREHFDCVLMDVQMPVMDGLEATRQIRANPAFATMPVIALTANALEEERQHCVNAGMNDFITKPVRPEILYATLAKWLSRQMPPLSVPDGRKKVVKDMPQQTAAIDFSVLAELVGNRREKMQQLSQKFLDTTRQDMDKIAVALAENDASQLKALGHHIKSPAAMMGAMGFAELCRALENNSGDPDKTRELVRQMQALFVEIESQIKAEFA